MIVVSDTSPICYLVLIDAVELLPQVYGPVIIPADVKAELMSAATPQKVRNWLREPPAWLTVQENVADDESLGRLDSGERAAILLAEAIQADAVLIDEKAGRAAAAERGLRVIGLLGVLIDGANLGLIDFKLAAERLQETSFWVSPKLLQSLIQRFES